MKLLPCLLLIALAACNEKHEPSKQKSVRTNEASKLQALNEDLDAKSRGLEYFHALKKRHRSEAHANEMERLMRKGGASSADYTVARANLTEAKAEEAIARKAFFSVPGGGPKKLNGAIRAYELELVTLYAEAAEAGYAPEALAKHDLALDRDWDVIERASGIQKR